MFPDSGSHGKLLSRSSFLGGKVRCYFGPGQPPNAAPQFGIDWSTDGSEIILPYSPPDDWPPAGMLLRVPKVVYISVVLPQYSRSSPNRYSFVNVCGSHDIVYDESYPPLWHNEFTRLKAAADHAKDVIEGKYPGKVFVQNVDWLDPEGDLRYAVRDQYLHMPAPPVDTDLYFGTNFLHVYVGHFAYDYDDGAGGYLRIYSGRYGTGPSKSTVLVEGDLGSDLIYQAAKVKVVEFSSKLAGYRTAVFGYKVDDPGLPAPPVEVAGIDCDPALVAANNAARVIVINNANSGPSKESTSSNKFLKQTVADLADFGYTYEGESPDVSSESIVALIEGHFGLS